MRHCLSILFTTAARILHIFIFHSFRVRVHFWAQIKNGEIMLFFLTLSPSSIRFLRLFCFDFSSILFFSVVLLMDKFHFLYAHTPYKSPNKRTQRTYCKPMRMEQTTDKKGQTNERAGAKKKINKIRRKDKKR